MIDQAMTPSEFEAALRAKGAYYHIHHPFHQTLYAGGATRRQIQGWVANRFYYQLNIPLKDAAILGEATFKAAAALEQLRDPRAKDMYKKVVTDYGSSPYAAQARGKI